MIFLNDLLEADDFRAAAAGLAREFREEFELPGVHQLGLVVPDVEGAAMELERTGMGPFFIASGKPVLWRERGEERAFAGKLGIAYHGGLELELLEPGVGSDFYGRSLDPEGRVVVQHLGMVVKDVDEWAVKLVAKGHPIRVRGRLKSGPMVTEFAYMDTEDKAGLVLEFISWRLFGRVFNPRPSMFHAFGRLEKLVGKRSISM